MELAGIDTRVLFTGLVALVAAVRLAELRLAGRNYRNLLARGGVEAGAGHYPWMVALHVAWLAGSILEVWLLGRPFRPGLAAVALVLLAGSMGLRWWVIATLGERWTTRVVCLPGAPPVAGGPYRWLRHPNYLAVVVEIAALPLVHGAWITALAASLADAALLRVRIAAEERALAAAGGGWSERFAGLPRLVPGGRGAAGEIGERRAR
jgi:methyltransferase